MNFPDIPNSPRSFYLEVSFDLSLPDSLLFGFFGPDGAELGQDTISITPVVSDVHKYTVPLSLDDLFSSYPLVDAVIFSDLYDNGRLYSIMGTFSLPSSVKVIGNNFYFRDSNSFYRYFGISEGITVGSPLSSLNGLDGVYQDGERVLINGRYEPYTVLLSLMVMLSPSSFTPVYRLQSQDGNVVFAPEPLLYPYVAPLVVTP